ncbi:MAG: Rne/Rng family ribonuclease [Acaryochloridaceae cyanobacterium RL_2_7]|nr:Rne/Rng family ribonuclease [Acaryochloridaceae cyanobacterium RL_2_7]
MSKQIVIAEQYRIASVFAEEQIQELIVATGRHQVSDIYLGVVENILPSIDAAFVNLGDTERNGFIHVSDLGPIRLRRTSGSITELLAPQQKVLVQIMKEPTGNKGPRLTGNISLPGRYLVLMPYGRGVNLSRRINSDEERSRLRALGILIKPSGMGLLVRTEADGISEEAIIEDLELLQSQWEAIQQQASSHRAPALLDRDTDFIQKVLRDVYSSDVNRIVVDSEAGLQRVKKHLMNWNGNRLPQGILIDQHRQPGDILEYFRVNAAIKEALKPRVDLPSGGYIIIERTEALTVVDVNSGSFTRSATARETVLWTNCEAAVEIARQLRLRNIAGVIIVDFIDMDSRRDQLQVLEQFNKALKADKARPQIAQLSELGLVELTRKRQGQNIYELFGNPCPSCGGLGHLAHLPGADSDTPGEIVERQVPTRSFGGNQFPPPRATGGFETQSELQELDLLNHPSYQEQGGRKRRYRSRLDSTLSGDSGRPKLVRKSANDSRSNSSAEESRSRSSSNGSDRRRSRREPPAPKVAAPPEVITVSMSEPEKHVYAFLGIPPVAKYEGTVKNPKSAIVNIVAEASVIQASEGETKTDISEKSTPIVLKTSQRRRGRPSAKAVVEADLEALNNLALDEETESEAGVEEQKDPPKVRVRTRKSSSASSTAVPTPVIEDKEEEDATEAPKTRRRRRRSSALSKQLSLETT